MYFRHATCIENVDFEPKITFGVQKHDLCDFVVISANKKNLIFAISRGVWRPTNHVFEPKITLWGPKNDFCDFHYFCDNNRDFCEFLRCLSPKTPHETYSETSDLDETLRGRSCHINLEFQTYRSRFNRDLSPVLIKIGVHPKITIIYHNI